LKFEIPDTRTESFVCYHINDSVEVDLIKYGEFSWTLTPSNTITQERAAVETEIKTRENIS